MNYSDSSLRKLGLVTLLAFFSMGLAWLVLSAPEEYYTPEWVLGEQGNQCFRADQLAQGRILYRDVECQHGPLPIYAWFAFTRTAGNTISANIAFHAILTLILLGSLFWWATGSAASRTVILAVLTAIMTLTFARTFFFHLLAHSFSNTEYTVFERLCLLGLIVVWRPPGSRQHLDTLALVALFTAWQLVKVGGAFIGLAAFGCVDCLWLLSCGRPWPKRSWLAWWLTVTVSCVAVEALRCGVFVWVAGAEFGMRSAWPIHVAREYQRTWLTLWAGPKHFISVVLPILGLVIPLLWLVVRSVITRRRVVEEKFPLIIFQGAVGASFFGLGAIPRFGYFGHEWLFFQYQWALLPLALASLRPSPALGLAALITVHAGPLYHLVKEIQRASKPVYTERIDTPIGAIRVVPGDPRGEMLRTALALRRNDHRSRTLIIAGWGGGGWYVVAGELHRPRNIFFSSSFARTEQDDMEFNRLLARASLVLVQTAKATDDNSDVLASVAAQSTFDPHLPPGTPIHLHSTWLFPQGVWMLYVQSSER